MTAAIIANIPKCDIQRAEIDLRELAPEAVIDFFDERTASGEIVLHGTGEHYPHLRPMPACDYYSEGGSQTAVYATAVASQALKYAVYNQHVARRIAALAGDIEVSHAGSPDGRRMEYAFMPVIYEAVTRDRERRTDLLHDGYIHELPRHLFTHNPDDSTEVLCRQAIAPLKVYAISRTVGHLLFGNSAERFSTRAFTPEECDERRRIHVGRFVV